MLSAEPNSASARFLRWSVVWLVFAVLVGLTAATKFVFPDFLAHTPWLAFGRLRPIHVNTIIFGWLQMGLCAAMLYIVPQLTRTRLYSEPLGHVACWLNNLIVAAGVITLALGITQGKEYEEYVWPYLDVALLLALALIAVNVFATIARRTEPQLYVSLWYFMGSLIWMPLLYGIGNFPFYSGVNDANVNWFYGHNLIGLWVTPLGVGIGYYLLPKIINTPLFSHRLSLLGFWTIALFYVWTGAHHLIYGPVPVWLQNVAIISSLSMILPVVVVVLNVFLTMRGHWSAFRRELSLRFLLIGMVAYMITCLQGPLQSMRWLNAHIHFTNWVVGHAHLALLATFSFVIFAAVYFILPRLAGRPWHSRRLGEWHFWLTLLGAWLMVGDLTISGWDQGTMWFRFGGQGIAIVRATWVFYLTRMLAGVLIVAGQLIFAYNVARTVRSRPAEAS